MTGRRSGTWPSGSASTQSINPGSDFKAGELISLSLTTGIQNSSNVAMSSPYVLQFLAAAGTGPAYYADVNATFGASTAATYAFGLGDIDGDGDIDIVQGANGGQDKIILNSGNQSFSNGSTFGSSVSTTTAIVLADFDRDGYLDAFVGALNQQNRIFYNTGGGAFNNYHDVGPSSSATVAAAVADFDGDGWLDIVVGNSAQQSRVYINDGTGEMSTTSRAVGPTTGRYTSALAVGDIDGDGDIDIALVAQGGTSTAAQNTAYFNSNGFFSASGNFGASTDNSTSIALGDLDSDGDLDFVVGNQSSQNNVVYLNTGSFPLTSGTTFSTGETTRSVALGDIDGDGDLDIVESNNAGSNHTYQNNGSGSFSSSVRDFGSSSENSGPIALADMDGDNALDIVVGNRASSTLSTGLSRVYYNSVGNQTLAFSSSSFSVEEHQSSVTISVSRTGGSTGAVSVNYATSNGTATSGNDYTSASGTLSWSSGDASTKTFTVSISDDSSAENDETVTLTLSNLQGYATLGSPSSATLTIIDNDTTPSISLSESAIEVQEDAGTATYTVQLNRPFSSAVTCDYATANGSAIAGSDYTSASGSLTFAANEKSKEVTVSITDDGIVENDETFTIGISNISGATTGTNQSATTTIKDNDTTTTEFTLASSSATVDEDAGSVTLTVNLGVTPGASTYTVDYATSNGSAASGDDYTGASGTLSFTGTQSSQTVTLNISEDSLYEADETFTFTISNPSAGSSLGTTTSATVTIKDNDNAPTLEFQAGSITVNEDGGTVDLNLTLSAASGTSVSADWAASDNTTSSGVDYQPATGSFTIDAGTTFVQITITINEDTTDENDETFVVSLSNVLGASVGTRSTSTVTIVDNDAAPTVSFASSTSLVEESVGTTSVTVQLSAVSGKAVTVNYATTGGTALSGNDFTATSGLLTIPAGESSGKIDVSINDDGMDEPDENFTVAITSPNNATLQSPSVIMVTIQDDDDVPAVEFNASSYSVNEGDPSVTVTVTLSNTSTQAISVAYATSSGTAFSPSDFTDNSGQLQFAAGESSATFSVVIQDDANFEGDEYFEVTLSNPSAAAQLGTQSTSSVLIVENDAMPEVTLSNVAVTASEGDGTVQLTLALDAAAGIAIDIPYHTEGNTATAGDDFTSVTTGIATIPAGSTTQTIDITITDDALNENSEEFSVVLDTPSLATVGTEGSGTVTITDNDPLPTISVGATSVSVDENAGTVVVNVALNTLSGRDVSVDFAMADVSATDTEDYTAFSGTATVVEGDSTASIIVTILDDLLIEADETFTITLSNPVNATLGTELVTTITIVEDEAPPELNFTVLSGEFDEGVVNASIEVTSSAVSTLDVEVDFAFADDTALGSQDYSNIAGTLVIPAGETTGSILVAITDDTEVEDTEIFVVSIASPVNSILGSNLEFTASILDNDLPEVAYTLDSFEVQESDAFVTLTVALNVVAFKTVTLNYATATGTAITGLDFAAAAGSFTFLPGETSKTFNVSIIDDVIDEADESVTLTLANIVNGIPGANAQSEALILDDEVVTVQFATTSSMTSETAGPLGLILVADLVPHADFEIDVSTIDDTAAAPIDFSALSGPLTFPGGVTSHEFFIDVQNDVYIEADETFSVFLSNPASGILIGTKDTHTVTLTSEDIVPTLTVDASTVSAAESSGMLNVDVFLSEPFNLLVTTDYSTAPGSAVAGADYETTTGSLSFVPGETTKTISVPIYDDGIAEVSEVFLVQIQNPGNALIGTPSSTTVTIEDDDFTPPPPPPTILGVTVLDGDDVYIAGDTVTLMVTLDSSTHTVSADFSGIDSAMATELPVPFFGSNTYRVTTTALNASSIVLGQRRPIVVTATNATGQSTTAMFPVTVLGDVPVGRLLFSQPADNVRRGELRISLVFDELIVTRPNVSISGLGGSFDVTGQIMSGDTPGLNFQYAYVVASGLAGTGTVSVSNAFDAYGRSASIPADATIEIVAGNPVLESNAGVDIDVPKPGYVFLDGSASVGASSYQWRQIGGPEDVAIEAASSAQARVALSLSGVYAFELEVSDGTSSAFDAVTVTLGNLAPIVDAGPDLYLSQSAVVSDLSEYFADGSLYGSVFEPNGEEYFISWRLASAPAASNIAIENASQLDSRIQVFGTLMVPGVYLLELKATDITGATGFDSMRLIVTSASIAPPSADAGTDQNVLVGDQVELDGKNSKDPDAANQSSPVLSFNWTFTQRPAGSSAVLLGPNTSTPAFTPDLEGIYTIQLIVADPGGISSSANVVRVIAFESGPNANNPPRTVLTRTHFDTNANGAVNVNERVIITAANSEDANSDSLTYSWEQIEGPVPLLFSSASAELQDFRPQVAGNYVFRVTANDGTVDGIPAEYHLAVANSGFRSPFATVELDSSDDADGDGTVLFIPDLGVDKNTANPSITLHGGNSFGDSSLTLHYRWTQVSGPPVGLVGAGSATLEMKPLTAGVVTLRLTVYDDHGIRDSADIPVAVNTYDPIDNPNGNTLPSADGGVVVESALELTPGEAIALAASGFDPNGSPLSFKWEQIGGPPIFVDVDSLGQGTAMLPVEGTYIFNLFARDGIDTGLPSEVSVVIKSTSSGGDGGGTSGKKKGGGGGCSLFVVNSPSQSWYLFLLCATLWFFRFYSRRTRERS